MKNKEVIHVRSKVACAESSFLQSVAKPGVSALVDSGFLKTAKT